MAPLNGQLDVQGNAVMDYGRLVRTFMGNRDPSRSAAPVARVASGVISLGSVMLQVECVDKDTEGEASGKESGHTHLMATRSTRGEVLCIAWKRMFTARLLSMLSIRESECERRAWSGTMGRTSCLLAGLVLVTHIQGSNAKTGDDPCWIWWVVRETNSQLSFQPSSFAPVNFSQRSAGKIQSNNNIVQARTSAGVIYNYDCLHTTLIAHGNLIVENVKSTQVLHLFLDGRPVTRGTRYEPSVCLISS